MRTPTTTFVRSRVVDFGNLARYLRHASEVEFARKPEVQRQEVLCIVRKLLTRCCTWQTTATVSPTERQILVAAERLLTTRR